MRKLILFLLFLGWNYPPPAIGAAPPAQMVFKHLGISEGFNQTNVTTLYQDENGTIWAAGVGGVVRYRGLQTEEPLMPERAAELFRPMNVKGIYGEQNGLIYFYQLRNIVEYDLRRETFRPLFTDSLLDSRSISAATVRGGRVYAAAGDRIVIAAPDGKCSQLLLPPMSEVSALACTAGGVLYVGTLHSGLYRLDERGAAECILPTASKISSLFEDSRGDLWVCTRSEGLYRLDAGGGVRRFVHDPRHPEGLADNYVRCICEDDEGRLWIGMMFGLDCYDPASDRFYHFGRSDNPLYGMRNLTVECIMRDRRGAIWFGSFYTGISYFHPHEALFRVVPIEGGDTTWTIVADVTLDRRGDVWAGTSDKGLYFYDRTRRRGRFFNMGNSGIPSNNVKSIRYDAGRDQLWLGMFMGGVCVYDIPSGRFERLKIADQGGGSENIEIVHSLSREGDAIYAGTYAGVYRIDMRTRRAERILNQQRVFNVLSGGDGWLYVVTGQVNFRVYRRDEAGVYQLYFNRVVQQDMVTSLFRDDRGRAWVGTTRSGALLFDRERKEFVVYDRAACGIASDYVSAISQTPSGLMVFGTNAGLSVVDADSLRSENFNIRNGFPLLSLENGCLWRGGGDEMLAGGVDGIVSFAGRDLIRTGRAPQLFFAALSVNERPVRAGDRTGILDRAMPYAKSISLGHRYSIVDIAFGTDNAVDFNLGDYQYKLIGYDEAWRPLPGSIIRYMNLPPGHYRLAVQSRPTKLLDGGGRIELGIRVYPPFYASIPAYILYVLLIMLITAWVVRYYYTKKQLEQSLAMERMAREQQERITQWKLVFFTNISHEFRTPLTLIQGQLDLLARQEMPGVLKGYLMSVRRNALRLRDLVNELIDFRKQEQGYMSLKVSRQDLVAYLADVCGTFEEYGRIREVELRYEPGMERLEVPFDSVQLQKVFYNLISNAFKHTDRGGRITVTLSADDAQAVVKVADTGHGIEEKFFTTIFERFYHHEADTQDAGVGIGLALSKGIVELHGGRIGVESEVGVGSTFTVTLLLNPDFSGNANVEVVGTQEHVRPAPVADYLPAPERIPGSEELPRLLVVEDDDELRSMFGTIFAQHYRVTLAADGTEGLRLAREEQPDLIVSDVLMPGMSGTELCAAVKREFGTCHIPVILLTALSSPEQRITGLESGADDYVSKPFDMDVLMAKCNGMVRNRRLLQRKFLEGSSEPASEVLSGNPMDEAFVRKTLALIGGHLDSESLGVGMLSRELALSRTALFAKIKGVFGQTPTELIQGIRLREAARMLAECPELKIAEIADRVGINSLQYFGKLFKARYGCTPSEYRTAPGERREGA